MNIQNPLIPGQLVVLRHASGSPQLWKHHPGSPARMRTTSDRYGDVLCSLPLDAEGHRPPFLYLGHLKKEDGGSVGLFLYSDGVYLETPSFRKDPDLDMWLTEHFCPCPPEEAT